MRNNNSEKFLNALSQYKVKCKCGHVVIIIKRSWVMCSWCGRKIYRSKKDEFKDKLKKEIKKK